MRAFCDGELDTFVEPDIAFHQAVAACTGNSLIVVQVEGLEVIQRGVSAVFSGRARSAVQWRETLARHEAIARAIRKGDPAAAESAMREHFAAADLAALQLSRPDGGDQE
jgi:GntR family transcriptional repressor for pyruvate dehydrogenase complex